MASYEPVVRAHASKAVVLYRQRLAELERLAGFPIAPDGSNGARSKEDARRYLAALDQVAGSVAVVSARLVMRRAAMENGLDADL